jgi:hypothetical protein
MLIDVPRGARFALGLGESLHRVDNGSWPQAQGDAWRPGVATWARSTAAAELAWRLLWWCRPCRRTPTSRSASSASKPAAREGPEPYSYLALARYSFPSYLAWAALQLPLVEVEEVPM